jgi:hypothetical protein
VGRRARDTVVDDPVDEEAEGHAEGALRMEMLGGYLGDGVGCGLTILVGNISAATT